MKLATGCVDCGYTDHAEALEYDHRPGEVKVAGIAAMVVAKRPWPMIEAEIAKCDLVCANCHRVRTTRRREMAIAADEDADMRRGGVLSAKVLDEPVNSMQDPLFLRDAC